MDFHRLVSRQALTAAGLSVLLLSGTVQAQQGGQNQQGAQAQQQRAQQQAQGQPQRKQQAGPMQIQQVRGEIVDLKRAAVRGTNRQNVLALIETPAGKRTVVDLGYGIRGKRFQQGQRIAVRGEPVQLGQNRRVLMAHAVRLGGRTYDINRPGPTGFQQVRGNIVDVRRAQLGADDRRNVLALIETPAGKRVAVDLGTGIEGMRVRQGQQFAARGTPVQVGPNRYVLMAHAARLGGRTYDVNRPAFIPDTAQAAAQ